MTSTINHALFIVLALTLCACTNHRTSSDTQKGSSTENKINDYMKNPISIVEIPTTDFARATTFYQAILGIKVETVEMEGITMGLFPGADQGISVQLIHGGDYKPSSDGTLVYLNGGEDLQQVLDRITPSGGKILLPKTVIGPEMGFYALFFDTEGNKLGLHSFQ